MIQPSPQTSPCRDGVKIKSMPTKRMVLWTAVLCGDHLPSSLIELFSSVGAVQFLVNHLDGYLSDFPNQLFGCL
jgi:hypothetical protein